MTSWFIQVRSHFSLVCSRIGRLTREDNDERTGDPLRYHSHFTLTILSTPTTSVMPLDLVAYGRLATAVKKSHLLASWNEEKGEAEYLSLEWAAFG